MSHPENTLKQIIERQDKKILLLTQIVDHLVEHLHYEQNQLHSATYRTLHRRLNEVRKL